MYKNEGDLTQDRIGMFLLRVRRTPRSTQGVSSAASGVYKGQGRFPKEVVTMSFEIPLSCAYRVTKGEMRMGKAIRVAMMYGSYTHLRAHETLRYVVCRLLLEKKNINRFIYTTLSS